MSPRIASHRTPVNPIASVSAADLERLLERLPAFARLGASDRRSLAGCATRRDLRRGEFVFRQGDVWPFVLVIAAGRLEWSMVSPEGRRQALFDLRPGKALWSHSLFDDGPMPADLEVMEPSVTFRWDRETIKPILERQPRAMWEVSAALVESMRMVREIVYGFAFHSVSQRLAQLLLSRYPLAEGQPAARDLTLDEMAAFVGSTPALVSRILYTFADKGCIRITRTEFEFVDRGKLERLASDGQEGSG